MSTQRRFLVRMVAVGIVGVLTALLAEGAASLVLGRSLVRWISGRSPEGGEPPRMRMFDEERLRAAALSEGPFAADLDPLVSARIKGAFSYKFHDALATTDSRGVRTRVGPSPAAEAQRIVVLGDSVAFGFGLKDDETIAHHVEQLLAGTMTREHARPIALTVACPGWTLANSRRFLLDRLDDLKPDVVVLITVANDLDDSCAVLESGHRNCDFDPARGVEFPAFSLTYHQSLAAWVHRRFPSAHMGFYALYSGVTPQSRRRYGSAADGIVDLGARLAVAGAKLAVVALSPGAFEIRLAQHLLARGSNVPLLVLFDALKTEDGLEGDPHPNPRCARGIAWRLARHLIGQNWVLGARHGALPPEDDRYAGRVGSFPDPAQFRAKEPEWDRLGAEGIGPRIDFTDGTGWHQVYAGIWPDGVVGNAASGTLSARGGARLVVKVARLPDHPGLHPLQVRVFGNDVLLGTLDLPAPARGSDHAMTSTLDVPRTLLESGFLDVRLVPSEWVVEKVGGISRLAAFQLQSLALVP